MKLSQVRPATVDDLEALAEREWCGWEQDEDDEVGAVAVMKKAFT